MPGGIVCGPATCGRMPAPSPLPIPDRCRVLVPNAVFAPLSWFALTSTNTGWPMLQVLHPVVFVGPYCHATMTVSLFLCGLMCEWWLEGSSVRLVFPLHFSWACRLSGLQSGCAYLLSIIVLSLTKPSTCGRSGLQTQSPEQNHNCCSQDR